MEQKMTKCKACNQEIAKNAKVCPHCGFKNKKPIFKQWWFWVIITIVFVAIISSGNNTDNENNTNNINSNETINNNPNSVNPVTSDFEGDCGIKASAEIGKNIINVPELQITITNTTDKEIAAIQFYIEPYDVYGEKIKTWVTQNKFFTDTPISAGETTTISQQFLDQSIKNVTLYVYSVYFADGTEWGNKDATTSKITATAPIIEVNIKN